MNEQEAAWLARTQEEPIDPNREICDPHHHLWDHPESRYMLEELHGDTGAGHNVTSTVFVECASGYREDGPEEMRVVGETEFVLEVAQRSNAGGAVIAGIVSHANLLLGDRAKGVLEAHIEAGGGRFRGIRHSAAFDPSPDIRVSHSKPPAGMLLRSDFRRGFACLGPLELSFDAWLYHPQIDQLTDLAHAFPDTRIILDHVGGPLGIGPYRGRRREVEADWRKSMTELARCDNVVIKLGGLAMKICGFGWHKQDQPPSSAETAEAHRPYYLHCIDRFGTDRCMFESNFPVDRAGGAYTLLWNSFQRIVADFSEDEKTALFRDTARRVYRLGD